MLYRKSDSGPKEAVKGNRSKGKVPLKEKKPRAGPDSYQGSLPAEKVETQQGAEEKEGTNNNTRTITVKLD